MILNRIRHQTSLFGNLCHGKPLTMERQCLKGSLRWGIFFIVLNRMPAFGNGQFDSLLLAHHAIAQFSYQDGGILAGGNAQTTRRAQRVYEKQDVVLLHVLHKTVGG